MKKILLFFLLAFNILSFSEEEDLYNAATKKNQLILHIKKVIHIKFIQSLCFKQLSLLEMKLLNIVKLGITYHLIL